MGDHGGIGVTGFEPAPSRRGDRSTVGYRIHRGLFPFCNIFLAASLQTGFQISLCESQSTVRRVWLLSIRRCYGGVTAHADLRTSQRIVDQSWRFSEHKHGTFGLPDPVPVMISG